MGRRAPGSGTGGRIGVGIVNASPVDTRTVRSIDVPIGSGRQTLRISATFAEDGTPEALILALGFGGVGGEPFNRPGWCDLPLSLPADAIPQLRAALEALEARP